MNLWQEYKRPSSIDEALQELTTASGSAMPIAGGTDLLLELKQAHQAPVHTLIDLTFIPELMAIELRRDDLFIGAAASVNRIAFDPDVGTHAQALVEACNLIAGPQVRNMATLGGNVAHALPAADGTIALLALDAQAEVARVSGTRRVPLSLLFLGPGKTAIDKTAEIITGFYIPILQSLKIQTKRSSQKKTVGNMERRIASCFKRIMRPQGVALPILNCAVWLERASDSVKAIRIAVGPGGPVPFRAMQTERFIRGNPLDELTTKRAVECLMGEVKFRSSARRASEGYRKQIIDGLFRSVLDTAWQRAQYS